MSITYKYGLSFNCETSSDDDIGDCSGTLDAVSNDLDKIIKWAVEGDSDFDGEILTDHELIGEEVCDLGGEIVAVLVEKGDEDQCAVAVIFEEAEYKTIILE
jgi:hypothetical protein